MKITTLCKGREFFYNRRFFLQFRLTSVLIIILSLQLSASAFSQNISISVRNAPLEQVFKEIRQQTGYLFLYDNALLKRASKVSINLKSAPLQNVLELAFKDQPFTYSLVEKTIVIKPLKETVNAEPTSQAVFTASASNNAVMNKSIATRVSGARAITVRGTVSDSKGQGIPGASVRIKDLQAGTTADSLGRYTLSNVPEGATLVFSFLGFTSKEVAVNSQTTINVTLESEDKSLEEVVVIGYGTVSKKDVTGAVASVSAKDFADQPVARLEQALTGKIAGLDILTSSGRPGTGSTIQLRGRRSLVASNDPLIILDGMQYDGVLGDLNPYDIASVDVLKDASSTAIYGSRGANGVIIITSKRGITQKPKITFESTGGIQSVYGRLPYANGPQYAEWAREAYRTQGGYPFSTTNAAQDAIIFDAIELPTVTSGGEGLDYQSMVVQNGNQQKYQLTVAGGSETSKYNVTGNYFKQEGIMKGDVFNRISLSPKLDFTISPHVTAGTSIQLNYTVNSEISNERALTQYAFNGNPLGQVYEKDGVTPRFATTTDGFEINPMVDYWYDSHRGDNKGWGGSLNAFTSVKIIPGLTYRLQLGTNFRLGTNKVSDGYYSIARNLGLPVASVANSVNNFKSYQSILTYDKRFNTAHHFTATLINEFQSSRQETSGAGVSDIPYEAARYNNLGSANTVSSVSSGLRETSLLSYAARLFYGYKSKYIIQATVRADAASQLAPGHKWGYFPSASVAWTIAQEDFMKSTRKWLSDLKLRISYGVVGNQAIAPYQTQGSLLRTTYSFNEVAGFGYRQNSQSNKDLKWESSEAFNYGLDYSLFNGKVTGNFELYRTNTYDLLMFRKLPITSGYDQVLQNVGSTLNKGVEMSIRTQNITKPNFRWSTGLQASRNRTEITSLYNGTADDIGNGWFIGHDINVYYDFKKTGIWQTSEASQALSYGRTVGQIKTQDINNDGKINASDMVILGDHQPDVIGNLSNNFTYKNWDLAIAFQARLGGMTSVDAFAPYAKKRYNKFIFDYWTPNNPTNAYPRPNQLYEGSGLDGSTLTYRNQSQISMQIFALGYTIPKTWLSKLKVSNARIYLSGENLWYWTKSELRDFNMKPDFAGNTTTAYPATRTFIMGLNVGF